MGQRKPTNKEIVAKVEALTRVNNIAINNFFISIPPGCNQQ